MNKTAYLIFVLSVAASVAGAHEEMQTPEEMMNVIMARQGVVSISQVNCGDVAEMDFEMLGDVVMERMTGSHELHEQMDSMMGGEGSVSLRQMHIVVGQNWLGCGQGAMGSEMMNVNMMPTMMRMMGNYYPGYYSGYDLVLAAGAAGWILFSVTLYFYFLKKRSFLEFSKSKGFRNLGETEFLRRSRRGFVSPKMKKKTRKR